MRFLLDHNVDARVCRILRDRGHDAWTASEAGHATSNDDDLVVYAAKMKAVLVTHDRELCRWRQKFPLGRLLALACLNPAARELVEKHIDAAVEYLNHPHITVVLSAENVSVYRTWGDPLLDDADRS